MGKLLPAGPMCSLSLTPRILLTAWRGIGGCSVVNSHVVDFGLLPCCTGRPGATWQRYRILVGSMRRIRELYHGRHHTAEPYAGGLPTVYSCMNSATPVPVAWAVWRLGMAASCHCRCFMRRVAMGIAACPVGCHGPARWGCRLSPRIPSICTSCWGFCWWLLWGST